MRRAEAAGIAALALASTLAACVSAPAATPSATTPPTTVIVRPTDAVPPSQATPDATPSASERPGSRGPIRPGRPYDAGEVLAAMRSSRRPGGVPEVLQTQEIAGAVADRLWTWSGDPWTSLSIGGACGPETCSLDVAGAAADGSGEDLYQLEVRPANGSVRVLATELGAYPPELDRELDAIARAALGPRLEGLVLASARWLPPPDAGRFVLAYRSGGEEGSPAADVTVDLATREVIESG